mgnify:FL=1
MAIEKYVDNLIWTIKEHAAGNLTAEGTTMCNYCEYGRAMKKDENYTHPECDSCMWHPKYASEEGMAYLEDLKARGITMEALGLLD